MKFKVAYSLFLALMILTSSCAVRNGALFHPPRTGAEEALDALLVHDKKDENMYEYLLGRPSYDASKNPGYTRWVTQDFVNAVRAKEKELVQENCGGEYVAGELCGIDVHLPICAQDDSSMDYLFHTIRATATEAHIVYAWQEHIGQNNAISGPVFRMVLQDEVWKLDGLDCGEDYRFNAPLIFR